MAFSKNNGTTTPSSATPLVATEVMPTQSAEVSVPVTVSAPEVSPAAIAEGDVVTSPLVGVAYLKPAPDKSDFIAVGDTVKKGQTLLIIEAMKVMNEIPAPRDGVVTEILVQAEAMVEYGEELVRIK